MKKGITVVALIATVTIMIILVGTVTITSINSINNSKRSSFATELLSLQDAIKQEKVRGNLQKVLGPQVVVDISLFSVDEKYQFSMERVVGNKITLNEVDLVMLGTTKTTRGVKTTADDIFAYSNETGRVYYVKGFKVDKVKYYGLYGGLADLTKITVKTDDDNQYIDKTVIEDLIEIKKTGSSYSNKWVGCEIKIPSKYSEIKITSNAGSVEDLGIRNGFATFDINQGTSNVQKYTVNGSYNVNGTVKSFVYNVDNIDVTAPTIDNSNIIQNYITNSSTGKTVGIIEVRGISDNESGIKNIKYEKGNISNPTEYFKSAGKIAENNIIALDYSNFYTICVEDNSGNMSSLVVTVNSDILERLI